jgi:hypothetical protein
LIEGNMSDQFDPYYSWLTILPKDQPPNHYRLLGVELFEENPGVIQTAAEQRMVYLRTFQIGKHAADSQRLLNEVAAAKVCLSNAAKKAAYDERLRQELPTNTTQASDSETASLESGMEGLVQAIERDNSPSKTRRVAKKSRPKPAVLIGAAALAVVVIGSVALWWGSGKPGAASREQGAASREQRVGVSPPAEKILSVAVADSKEEAKPPAPPVPPPAAEPKPQPKEETKTPPREEQSAEMTSSPKNAPAEKPEPKEEADAPAKKIAPPSAEEQERLVAAIDEIYKLGEAKDQAAKAALARKLLEEGRKSEGKRSEQFVMFRRCGEIARDAGEADLVLEAVDAMTTAGFNVQPFPLKARLLT